MDKPCGFTPRLLFKAKSFFKCFWNTGFKVWRYTLREVESCLSPSIHTVILVTRSSLRKWAIGKDMSWRFRQELTVAVHHFRDRRKELEDCIKGSVISRITMRDIEDNITLPFGCETCSGGVLKETIS